jgi:hypothetical protein
LNSPEGVAGKDDKVWANERLSEKGRIGEKSVEEAERLLLKDERDHPAEEGVIGKGVSNLV